MDTKAMNVYKTDNYRKFKKLLDNREVSPQRVGLISRSIQNVGYIPSPIIVNEKLEVIDGQGRLAACEKLKLPVYYVVVNGIGIKECRSMNLHQSNWTVKDFIHSYASGGDENYINLRNLMKEFEKSLGANVLYSIAYGKVYHTAGAVSEIVKSGKLVFLQKEYERARRMCDYLTEFTPIFNRIGGRKDLYYGAVRFMLTIKGCEAGTLKTRVFRRQASLFPVANMDQALTNLEECYNFRSGTKIYFATEYKKWLDEREKSLRKNEYDTAYENMKAVGE